MKEKIGIEKLIELLNEREIGEEGGELYYLSNGIIRDDGGNILYDYRIISKEFGFIKWLVENDKIDLGLYKNYMPNLGDDFSMASNIIMNLSIAEDPIGYLLLILK